MSSELDYFYVTAKTSLSEILRKFEVSSRDLILLDERTVITKPHLELLTDYPRSTTAVLVAVAKNGNTLVRQKIGRAHV